MTIKMCLEISWEILKLTIALKHNSFLWHITWQIKSLLAVMGLYNPLDWYVNSVQKYNSSLLEPF